MWIYWFKDEALNIETMSDVVCHCSIFWFLVVHRRLIPIEDDPFCVWSAKIVAKANLGEILSRTFIVNVLGLLLPSGKTLFPLFCNPVETMCEI